LLGQFQRSAPPLATRHRTGFAHPYTAEPAARLCTGNTRVPAPYRQLEVPNGGVGDLVWNLNPRSGVARADKAEMAGKAATDLKSVPAE
jgi:hypothetical protein